MAAQTEAPPQAPAINPKLIIPFVNSLRQVFSTMVKVETTVLKPTLKADLGASYDVSSVIGFSGDVVGTVVLSFQLSAAEKLVAALAGMPIAPDSADFADAVGELTNMIAGGAKQHLGAAASITCPTVIMGKGHHIARLRDVPCVVVPCTTPSGDFAIEINIKQVIPAGTR